MTLVRLRRCKSAIIVSILIFTSIGMFSAQSDPIVESKIDHTTPAKDGILPSSSQAVDYLQDLNGFFTENRGQVGNDSVRFYIQGKGVWFLNDGVVFDIRESPEIQTRQDPFIKPWIEEEQKPVNVRGVVLKLHFVGCNKVVPEGREELSHKSNFFYGNDSSNWKTNVPNYNEIYYENIYDGIDLKYYSNEKGLKYDFIVHPRVDFRQIRLRWEGAEELEVDEQGDLIIKTAIGDVVDGDLFVYQDCIGERHQVNGGIRIYDNMEYGFEISDNYCYDEFLIIDPSLEFSSYLGGQSEDCGWSVTVDPLGNPIVTGYTSSFNFPITPGAYQSTNLNGDVFITKFNSNGSSLLFSTYLGGSSIDRGWSSILDSSGNSYVTGWTISPDFPTTPGANDTSYNGGIAWGDIFAFKLNPNGSNLIYSTFIGGDKDDFGRGIAVDSIGNIYITGDTNSSNFPTTPGAYDTTINGYYDVIILKLNQNGSTLLYSTFVGGVGGIGSECGNDISIDSNGNVFVTGLTNSMDFPTTPGAYDTSYNGGLCDVFVLKLNPSGSTLIYSTFIGGSDYDHAGGIVLDSMRNIYISGYTESSDFPTTPGAYDTLLNGINDGFVLELNTSSSSLLFSTLIGGSGSDSCKIAIDSCNSIYVLGSTGSSDFPTTIDAYDTTFNGAQNDMDNFLSKLDQIGSMILYSTFIGGSAWDGCQDIVTHPSGSVYISGLTYSQDYPTTSGAYSQSFNGGPNDVVVMN